MIMHELIELVKLFPGGSFCIIIIGLIISGLAINDISRVGNALATRKLPDDED
jgi:hypothetical protein